MRELQARSRLFGSPCSFVQVAHRGSRRGRRPCNTGGTGDIHSRLRARCPPSPGLHGRTASSATWASTGPLGR
eukprot:5714231-Alexandrium_andersonii.AAC.1